MASSSAFNSGEEGSSDSEDEEYVESSTDTDSIGSLSLDIEEDMFVDARVEEDVDANADIGSEQGRGLTLISDQHKGFVESVKEHFHRNMRNWLVYPAGGSVFEIRNGYDAYKCAADGVPNSQTQASVPETQYDADAGLQEVPVRDEEDSDDFWNNIPNDCWNYGNKKD
ncbi:hypothetical protein L1887_20318 [Cichorium endivia]|nr:hypothetical protein L1887_20318 [Cichorium endivia]